MHHTADNQQPIYNTMPLKRSHSQSQMPVFDNDAQDQDTDGGGTADHPDNPHDSSPRHIHHTHAHIHSHNHRHHQHQRLPPPSSAAALSSLPPASSTSLPLLWDVRGRGLDRSGILSLGASEPHDSSCTTSFLSDRIIHRGENEGCDYGHQDEHLAADRTETIPGFELGLQNSCTDAPHQDLFSDNNVSNSNPGMGILVAEDHTTAYETRHVRKRLLEEELMELCNPVRPKQEFRSIQEEYTNICLADFPVALRDCNLSKNRYEAVIPYDQTRVILREDGNEGSDYINASYIKGEVEGSDRAYIATQGPLETTFPDFWRMAWETSCELIVMLTKESEHKAVKVDRYWPDAQITSRVYGLITVSLIEEDCTDNSIIHRVFQLAHSEHPGQHRVVEQYQYQGWPDQSVPETTQDIRQLICNISHTSPITKKPRLSSSPPSSPSQLPKLPKPTIVHCSAGIGRTGTFCAIHISIEKLYHYIVSNCITLVQPPAECPPLQASTITTPSSPTSSEEDREIQLLTASIGVLKQIDMYNIVRHLREQRPGMVQREAQYSFCYCAVQDEMVELGLLPDHLVSKLYKSREESGLPLPPCGRKVFGQQSGSPLFGNQSSATPPPSANTPTITGCSSSVS
ncbi:protein-tyrosine phosphatase 1 [Pelomyxa schiedti]|nr:protein-tyrosine phosphatase 1 [Pelomyxa schiedti]